MIKEVKSTLLWAYVINYFNGEEITGIFCEKELQKNKSARIQNKKKSLKEKYKLYLKCKKCDISFSSWIDKNDLV